MLNYQNHIFPALPTQTTKIRQSNFELLRIISILLIITMHSAAIVFDTQSVLNREILIGIQAFTNLGVSLFVLISGYFSINFRRKRLIDIICLALFYSAICLFSDIFLLHKSITFKDAIQYVFPLLTKKWWFITSYVVLYCISDWLNQACKNMDKASFSKLLLVLIGFFYIAPTILVFYEITDSYGGKGLVNMTILYLIGRYVREYGFPEYIKKKPIIIFFICTLSIFFLNSAMSLTRNTIILRFSRDNSMLILIASLCIFFLFSRKEFTSIIINKIASMVLGFYLCNQEIISIALFYKTPNINETKVWEYVICLLAIILLSCFTIETIRIYLVKLLEPIKNIIYKRFSKTI